MPNPVLKLNAVRNPLAGVIEIADERYDVRKYTGAQYQQASLLTADSPILELYDLARQVVPALPEELLKALDVDQVNAILLLASSGTEAVRAMFPNALSPEPPTSPG